MTIFSSDQLAAVLAQTIPLPAGHLNAIVGAVDAGGAQVMVGFQREDFGGTFQVQGAYRHTWAGNNQLGAKVIYSW